MFAMRMKLNDQIIKKDSIKEIYINGKKNGFSFEVQLAYYRGHYLSDIDLLEVYLHGKELPIYKLKHAITEFWSQVDLAKVHVLKPGGLIGEHEVELKLLLRIPYMQIGPEHDFMPLDSGEKVTISFGGE